jgi:glycosyltransferase involved in cell wall biosynthesis
VGTLEPRKNLSTLLYALASLKEKSRFGHKLVIVGGKGWLYEDTLTLIDSLGLGDQVILFGPASLDELWFLYNAALVFVFPSLYEGFGLPPLEAMACGTPVLSSTAASLREVLDEAALYAEPIDVEGWAQEIQRIVEDESIRAELRERGLRQAATYSWRRAASETLAVYRRVARAN